MKIPLTEEEIMKFIDSEIKNSEENKEESRQHGGIDTVAFGYDLGYLDALRAVRKYIKQEED